MCRDLGLYGCHVASFWLPFTLVFVHPLTLLLAKKSSPLPLMRSKPGNKE